MIEARSQAQEGGAGGSGTGRRKGVKAFYQPLFALGTDLEKTISTFLEWDMKFPSKGQCLMLDFLSHCSAKYVTIPGQFSYVNSKTLFL